VSREDNHERLLKLLAASKCEDCGLKDLRVLTFDHKNPKNKKATISTLVHKGHSWDIIQKEIKKCSIVCLVCHQIRECVRSNGKRQQYWESLNE
jgi:hypothetical protein